MANGVLAQESALPRQLMLVSWGQIAATESTNAAVGVLGISMKSALRRLLVLATVTLSACGGAESPDAPAPEAPSPADAATYRVTFRTDWTQAAFATQFPAGRHFSGLVGATHNDRVAFWTEDEIASAGIQSMAETGAKTVLLEEVERALRAGHAAAALSGSGIASTASDVVLEFTLTRTHPLVTLVSMVAPSPDWFVGVHKLALFESNQWHDKVTVPLEVYDAGSDDGASFASADLEAVPHAPIRTLTSSAGDTDFRAGRHRATGAAIGSFTFERLR